MLILTEREDIFCTNFDFALKEEGDGDSQKLSTQIITKIFLLKSKLSLKFQGCLCSQTPVP